MTETIKQLQYPHQNFYSMITTSARKYGQRPALIEDQITWNYRTLEQRINAMGAFMQHQGVKPGDKVAIVVTSSKEFIVIYLAASAAGAIVVPINTFLKNEEFEFILNDCKASYLFYSKSVEKEIKGIKESVNLKEAFVVDEHFDRYYQTDLVFKPHPAQLDDIAHIIYTSGTTGHPKGAMLSFRNVFSNMVSVNEIFTISPRDRFIVFLPMFHSFTLTVMVLLPLYSASSLVIMKSVFPFSNVLKQVLLKRVTVFMGIPAIYTAIAKAKIPWYFRWFNRVRLFISGSAPLSHHTISLFKKKFKRAKLLEGYGLSECSPAVSVNHVEKQIVSSVGLPLPGYQVKIVDEELVEVPRGQVGEIIVHGDCVMQGYLNNSIATQETIINGWLKTGDLGKMDEEGYLYIVDRLKDLIISKGINVYPSEIEQVLYQLDEIDAAAVIGLPDEKTQDEEVIAFVQLREGASLSTADIKAHLKKHLANYKIPKFIYFKDKLPTNATGKVLKRVLKDQLRAETATYIPAHP